MTRLEWTTSSQFAALVKRGKRKMGVTVAWAGKENGWAVVALEVAHSAASVRGVLDDHAHTLVGHWRSPAAAMQAAEDYARRWVKGLKPVPSCACDEIAPAKVTRKRRSATLTG